MQGFVVHEATSFVDKTRVRLVHRGLPDAAVDDHTQGRDHYLDRLATVSAGGDVGPDVASDAA
jgi:hypothetical protein